MKNDEASELQGDEWGTQRPMRGLQAALTWLGQASSKPPCQNSSTEKRGCSLWSAPQGLPLS